MKVLSYNWSGESVIGTKIGEIAVDSAFIQALLTKVLEKFGQETPVTMMFRKEHLLLAMTLKTSLLNLT